MNFLFEFFVNIDRTFRSDANRVARCPVFHRPGWCFTATLV